MANRLHSSHACMAVLGMVVVDVVEKKKKKKNRSAVLLVIYIYTCILVGLIHLALCAEDSTWWVQYTYT
jgi:hypothetical protein